VVLSIDKKETTMYPCSDDTIKISRRWMVIALVGLTWPLLTSGNAASDEHLGHAEETRKVISWSVSEEELNRLMPVGWQSQRETKGPHEGANFFLVLADKHDAIPADGGPAITNVQAAVWTGPAAGNGQAGYMVLGGMITPRAAPGDYGVFMPATFLVNRTTEQRGPTTLNVEEWEIRGEGAEIIHVRLAYDDEAPHQSYDQTRTFSRLDTSIQRFYKYDEDELILYSRSADIKGVSALEVDASGGPLTELLDGAELTAVVSMPRVDIEVYRPLDDDLPLMSERQQQLLVGRNDPS
jgi:hypothetical protein